MRGVIVSTCFIMTSLCNIIIKELPPGSKIIGHQTHSAFQAKKHSYECVLKWAKNPPLLVAYNNRSKVCTGFDRVHGVKIGKPENRNILLFKNDRTYEGCVELKAMFADVVSCHNGWLKYQNNGVVYCYSASTALNNAELKTRLENECSIKVKRARAVSIHSKKEQEFLRQNYMGIPELLLGLQKTENEWTWTDGSEMDYDKLDEKSKKKTCENKKCRFGSMQLNGRQRFWSYVNYPRSPLLCKYEATWNIP